MQSKKMNAAAENNPFATSPAPAATPAIPPKKKRKLGFKRMLTILLVVLALGGIGGSYYFYNQYKTIKENPNIEAQKETDALVASVGKIMELPKGETPTVATVLDKEKLKDQSFFSTAENGDKLLAYTKAMQAILYRPSTNKIVAVAPIDINQQEGVGQGNLSAPQANAGAGLRIAYYNGTGTPGLAGQAEKAVKAAFVNYQTVSLGDASKKDYTGTLVIDVSGVHGKEAGDLVKTLNGKVSSLPAGEAKPDADILIISGK
jgi:hypothetical protein